MGVSVSDECGEWVPYQAGQLGAWNNKGLHKPEFLNFGVKWQVQGGISIGGLGRLYFLVPQLMGKEKGNMQLGVQDKREAAPPKTLREKTQWTLSFWFIPHVQQCVSVWQEAAVDFGNLSEGCKSFLPFCGKQLWVPWFRINHIVTMQRQEKKTSRSFWLCGHWSSENTEN